MVPPNGPHSPVAATRRPDWIPAHRAAPGSGWVRAWPPGGKPAAPVACEGDCMRKYIIMGIQGSGKGTHAKMLAEDFDLEHLAVGDIFRWNVQHHTKLGAQIRRTMAAGLLVGDDLDGFVASATDPDREMRPESAVAMRVDLASFAGSLPRARSLGALVSDLHPRGTVANSRSPNSPRSEEINPPASGLSVTNARVKRWLRARRRAR